MNTHGYTLHRGSHESFEDGHCLLELAAHLAGEPHSHSPDCVCEVLATVGIKLNDAIEDDERRTRLLGDIAPLLVNTQAPEARSVRAMAWLDWLARTALPGWLDLAGLHRNAEALRQHDPVNEGNAAAIRRLAAAVSTGRGRLARAPVSNALCEGAAARAISLSGALAALNATRFSPVHNLFICARRVHGAALKAASIAVRPPLLEADTHQAFEKASRALLEPTVHRLQESAADLLRALATQKKGPFPR